MKKIALAAITFLYLFAGIASAQVKNVPAAVTSAFQTKYPDVKQVTWLKDQDGYAARFYDREEPCTVRYNSRGEWLDETKKLNFGDLRSNVRNAFSQSKFASWRAHEVSQIQAKNKETQYRILIRNTDRQSKYIYYDTKGQLTKEAQTM